MLRIRRTGARIGRWAVQSERRSDARYAPCRRRPLQRRPAGGDEEDGFRAIGDPTEGALVVAAAREGMKKPELEAALPRVGEVPFDSGRKRMTTVHRVVSDSKIPDVLEPVLKREGTPYIAITKGAMDSCWRSRARSGPATDRPSL